MNPILKAKLLLAKTSFVRTPVEKRIRLELETDGRHITFLLVSLQALGFAVHVIASPIVYRELLALRRFMPLPFIVGGAVLPCGIAICDSSRAIVQLNESRKVLLDYDFFGNEFNQSRMPYFMHPDVYRNGLHRVSMRGLKGERPTRIAFFGTRDRDFYTRDFGFPMLNREEILTYFFENFRDDIGLLDSPTGYSERKKIAVALDSTGGDRKQKTFLPLSKYLESLRNSDFVLSPPGWCMPLSHNLIEGMAAGCVPIINCSNFLYPALEHGVNCMAFHDGTSLCNAVKEALKMSPNRIKEIRDNVLAYYARYLAPGRWLAEHLSTNPMPASILVNAEETSIAIRKQHIDA